MPNRILKSIDNLVKTAASNDDILLSREETLRKKLEILVTTLHGRLALNADVQGNISDSLATAIFKLNKIKDDMAYGFSRSELECTQNLARTLELEARSRNSECWHDAVSVMRDILATWEELQGVTARARMIDDIRPDDSGYM